MPRKPPEPRRRSIPMAEWPDIDRECWQRGVTMGVSFDDAGPGAHLAAATRQKLMQGYGRWLGFLSWKGELDASVRPGSRVTLLRIRAYFQLMRDLRNSDHTIVGHLDELRGSLRIMEPGVDFSWLTKPNGVSVRSSLPMTKRSHDLHDSKVLYEWGCDLMDMALKCKGAVRRRVQYRDGLLIAIFAARAPRLRSVTGIRLDEQLIGLENGYGLAFGANDVKTRRPIEYGLPATLTRYMDRYLAVERLELLAGKQHNALWVNWNGDPLGKVGLEKRIRWWSEKKFGKPFSPHRFRHALGSSACMADPASPGLAPAVLGISGAIYGKHYNLAAQADAAQNFHASLKMDREQTEPVARNTFGGKN